MNDEPSGTFINPYTFVPLPPEPPQRGRPNGHLGSPELLSGILQLTITARSPLLIRGFPALGEASGQQGQRSKLPKRPDGTPFLPGSAQKGAFRSMHETLTGSCLRVLNSDFVPVYRDSAQQEEIRRLCPAVVERHDSADVPPEVRLCEPGDTRTNYVPQERLEELNNETPLTAGSRLAVHDADQQAPPRVTPATADTEKPWVLFLTDAKGRDTRHPYRAQIRRLGGRVVTVSHEAWRRYLEAVEKADDGRTANVDQRETGAVTEPVTFNHTPKGGPPRQFRLGHRYLASKQLAPGQPVWVRLGSDENEADKLQLSMLWRHHAHTDTAGQRAGEFAPCQHATNLCPSCQVFGSAQDHEDGKDANGARQHSYRGHVRFGDAHAVGTVTPKSVTLPPLGTPNPGSGQFYLVTRSDHHGNAAKDQPLREWGSAADRPEARRLRGRKHYWHTPTGTNELPERAQCREHHLENMVSRGEAFPTGTQFTATVTFTDLSQAQLGGLLAALNPGLLLDDPEHLHVHLGGGRPLGYGSCQIHIDEDESRVWPSGARYGGEGEVRALGQVSDPLAAFRESVPHRVRQTWCHIAKALNSNSNRKEHDKVAYPPAASWDQRGQPGFDKVSAFWKQSSGAEVKSNDGKRRGYPLTPLPDIANPDQSLPIVERAEEQELDKQHPPEKRRR